MTPRQRLFGIITIFALFIAMTPRETFWFAQTFGDAGKIIYSLRDLVKRDQRPTEWSWNTVDKFSFGIESEGKELVIRMPWAQAVIPPLSNRPGEYALSVDGTLSPGVTMRGTLCGRTFDLPGTVRFPERCFMIARHLRIDVAGRPVNEGNLLNYGHLTRLTLTAAGGTP